MRFSQSRQSFTTPIGSSGGFGGGGESGGESVDHSEATHPLAGSALGPAPLGSDDSARDNDEEMEELPGEKRVRFGGAVTVGLRASLEAMPPRPDWPPGAAAGRGSSTGGRDSVGGGGGGGGGRESISEWVRESVAALRVRPSRNVRLGLLFTFVSALGRGVWKGTVFSGYVYSLSGSNLAVGVAAFGQGTSQLVLAVAAGVLLGRTRRDRVLKLAGYVSVPASAYRGFFLAPPGSYF